MGRNMTLAFETARQRAALTPDQPEGWATLYFHEKINLGADADTALASHRARLDRLHRTWSARTDVPFAVVDGMVSYAAQVTESSDSLGRIVRAYWRPLRDRAVTADRMDRVAVEARWWAINEVAIRARQAKKPGFSLVAMNLAERFWNAGGGRDPLGGRLGSQIARLGGDTGEVRVRWTDRFGRVDARVRGVLLPRTGAGARPASGVRSAPSGLADRLLRRDDARRPLEKTVTEALRADSTRAGRCSGSWRTPSSRWATPRGARHLCAGDRQRLGPGSLPAGRGRPVDGRDTDRRRPAPRPSCGGPGDVGARGRLRRGPRADGGPETVWTRLTDESRARMRRHFLASCHAPGAAGVHPPRDCGGRDVAGASRRTSFSRCTGAPSSTLARS
jgi:hypothetical protein